MGFKWLERELNRALKIAGNNEKYQFIVVGIISSIFFIDIFLTVGPSIYFMDPVFQCDDSGKTYDESYACSRLDQCRVINDFTIVYKMELYCDQQLKRSIIQSSLSVGSLIGLIVMNVVADLKGRRTALLMDLGLAIFSVILTYVGAMIELTPLLIFASVLSGFSGYSLIIISYIMLGDVCQETMRQRSSVYINMCLSLGLCLFFVLDRWLNQWYVILIFFMALPIICITALSYLLIVQSPNYCLFQLRDQSACLDSLIGIAKINHKSFADVERIKFIVKKLKTKLEGHKQGNIQQNVFAALSKWKYLKIIICMSLVESGGNLCFYGIEYAINDIGYSFGINNLVIGITEIATTLVVGRHVTTMERKKSLSIVYAITPVLTMFFIFDFVSSSPFLCTLVIALMRIMTTTGYFMIVMIQTQSFPLEIQSIGAGSIQAFAQFGSIIAPLLNAFSINNGLPKITVMGATMFILLQFLYFVPESSSMELKKPQQKKQPERLVQSESPIYFFQKQ